MPQLAERMSRAVPSAIMAVAEKAKRLKAQGRDIISFSIGVPNFLPGEHVYAAAREALTHDSGQYGSNRGPDALLHRKEIERLIGAVEQKGLTLVPLELYFRNGVAKVTLALGRGKKQHDRREDLKRRDAEREVARALSHRGRD